MRILITGSTGMLGRDLTARFGAHHQVFPLSRRDADISDLRAIAQAISSRKPDAVIHTAAFTAVDDCESHPELAFRINAEGARNVAQACREAGIPLLYVSTDYVFDGEKAAPYQEDDPPNPLNVYGRSKLEGEKHVRDLAEPFWIVRTSWLFGPLGRNFVETVLNLARSRPGLQVVQDQVGSPTYTVDLAEKLEQLVEKAKPGIYHVTNSGTCSWFEFAQAIVREAGLDGVKVSPIASSASNRPARRPRNSRLANSRLEREGLGLLPPWQDALKRYLLGQFQRRGEP